MSLGSLVLLAPLMLLLVAVIRIGMGPPVLFLQERAGLMGRPFKLIKFRTMHCAFAAAGAPLPDGDRLTKLGRFLRRNSLDELPELINVVRGEMSLVGPRPLLVQYVPLYTPRQARRHEVRPGITGWAQTNGRNALTWEQKFQLDVWYVDNRTLLLDLKILMLTIVKVVCREGINQDGQATMELFQGSPPDMFSNYRASGGDPGNAARMAKR